MLHVAKFSGGKDSTAMVIKMVEEENNVPILIFNYVPGNMLPESIDYVRSVVDTLREELGVRLELHIIKGEDFFKLMEEKHKPFPNPKTLWCEYWLKQVPTQRWIRDYLVKEKGIPEDQIIVNVGVKLSDSPRRAEIYARYRGGRIVRARDLRTRRGYSLETGRYWLRFPILEWTDKDVERLLSRYPRIKSIIEKGYRELVNPSICLACPFHTWSKFYSRAPKRILLLTRENLLRAKSMKHIRYFKLGYMFLEKQLRLVEKALNQH